MPMHINGSVEFYLVDEWYEAIYIGVILMAHSDLNACLFGVDNNAGYIPLFPDRGLPVDCSQTLRETVSPLLDETSHPSWVLWSELERIDWDEPATRNDERISEFIRDHGRETFVTKWLNKPSLQNVRDALDRDPNATIEIGDRIFRRPILTRRDSILRNDFPLVMKLMACLAERFGGEGVRLTVYFG